MAVFSFTTPPAIHPSPAPSPWSPTAVKASLIPQDKVSPCAESSEQEERNDPTVKTLAPLSRSSTGGEGAVEEVYCTRSRAGER